MMLRSTLCVLLLPLAACELGESLDSRCSSLSGSRCSGEIAIDASDPLAPVFWVEGELQQLPDYLEVNDPDEDPCTYYGGVDVWSVDGFDDEALPIRYGADLDGATRAPALVEGRLYVANFMMGDVIGDALERVAGWSATFRAGDPDSVMHWDDLAEICDEPPPRTDR